MVAKKRERERPTHSTAQVLTPVGPSSPGRFPSQTGNHKQDGPAKRHLTISRMCGPPPRQYTVGVSLSYPPLRLPLTTLLTACAPRPLSATRRVGAGRCCEHQPADSAGHAAGVPDTQVYTHARARPVEKTQLKSAPGRMGKEKGRGRGRGRGRRHRCHSHTRRTGHAMPARPPIAL